MKKQKILAMVSVSVLSFGMVTSVEAMLITRLGGLAVYDTDLDITWLADANAGAGSVYDDGFSNSDGQMIQNSAKDWAASLVVNGVTGWRLPTTLEPDASCTGDDPAFNCTGSEMGHLFNVEGVSFDTPGLFSNIQNNSYWSATEYSSPSGALTGGWAFSFNNGGQNVQPDDNNLYAWAVYDGDVSAVPVPATVWLFGSGLVGLIGFARRKR